MPRARIAGLIGIPLLAALVPACASIAPLARSAPPAVELVAHRGESYDAPENTMAAFRLAWERGVRTIELDVHLTADGRAILSHDPNTRRATGVYRVIRHSTLDELRALDAGRWKGERWAGEKMPALEEVLATIPAGRRCFIEIKEGPDVVPVVARAIAASGKSNDQLVIISFNAETVAESKRRLPGIKAFYLSSFRQDSTTRRWSPTVDELIQTARRIGADGLDLSVNGPVDADFVTRVKAAGLEFHAWTIDDPAVARRMVEAGVDGITTNRAAWMREELARQGVTGVASGGRGAAAHALVR
ncbi:MAG: glycerophosphodiester phosphodiesterase [Gemmatimonadetes bacterium]|nr:glycerophosphodiester phosphodiesterase [Gemmatimonadota bacterium]